jgi:hypothetical protein
MSKLGFLNLHIFRYLGFVVARIINTETNEQVAWRIMTVGIFRHLSGHFPNEEAA